MTANVHHDRAILDAVFLEDVTQVNHPSNFRIVFRRNGKDIEEEKLATPRKSLSKVFEQHRIDVEQSVNLNELSSSPEKKKEFISQITRSKYEKLFMAFRAMDIDKDTATDVILEMANTGKVPELELKNNQVLALDLKQTNRGLKLIFGSQEKASQYADIHGRIFHGLRTRPVSIEMDEHGDVAGDRVVPAEHESNDNERIQSEKSAYSIETDDIQPHRSVLKKMMFRIRSKLKPAKEKSGTELYPVFILGGLQDKLVIWSSQKDIADIQNQESKNHSASYHIEKENVH